MQIFPHMEEIYLDTYEQFVEEVDVSRKKMLDMDIELLKQHAVNIEMKRAKCLPQGYFQTIFESIKFECFFYYKAGKPLYVFLNGARQMETGQRAVFFRWSYYSYLNGSMLNIADPMWSLYPDLRLGWYYGDGETNFRKIVADLVLMIASIYNISSSDIVFVGSSGGGAAAIECAGHIKGAKAVAINPQVVLSEYGYAKDFVKITGNNLDEDEKWHRNNAIFYLQNNLSATFFIIVNLRSHVDMKQLQNICRAKKITVKYGLNIFDNLFIWIYDGNQGLHQTPHNTQEYYCIWFLIEHLVENAENREYLKENEALYRLAGEFWYEHWDAERKWKDRIGRIQEALIYSNKKCETAIFGTGHKATQLSKALLSIMDENYFHIKFALDNDIKKRGSSFQGIPIKHPSDIDNWDEIYVIITSDLYDQEIRMQLEGYGLSYGKDFISYKDLYD